MRRYLPLLALLAACDAPSSSGNTYTPDVAADTPAAEVNADCAEQCAATGACEFVDGACRPTKADHCRDNAKCQAEKHKQHAFCCFAEGPKLCASCGLTGVSPHPYQ